MTKLLVLSDSHGGRTAIERVLMDEQVSKKQKLYLISKEARVGLCNGLILGVLSFLFIGLYLYLLKGQVQGHLRFRMPVPYYLQQ